jgi:hypothetical protein
MHSAPDGGKRPTAVGERASSLPSHPFKGLNVEYRNLECNKGTAGGQNRLE